MKSLPTSWQCLWVPSPPPHHPPYTPSRRPISHCLTHLCQGLLRKCVHCGACLTSPWALIFSGTWRDFIMFTWFTCKSPLGWRQLIKIKWTVIPFFGHTNVAVLPFTNVSFTNERNVIIYQCFHFSDFLDFLVSKIQIPNTSYLRPIIYNRIIHYLIDY